MVPIDSIFVGLIFSFAYTELTGFYPGGVIVPIYFAFFLHQPQRVIGILLVSFVTWGIYLIVQKWWILFGRRRFVFLLCVAGLCSLCMLRIVPYLFPDQNEWGIVGWMIPGILANTIEKQGIFISLAGLFIVAMATYMVVGLW